MSRYDAYHLSWDSPKQAWSSSELPASDEHHPFMFRQRHAVISVSVVMVKPCNSELITCSDDRSWEWALWFIETCCHINTQITEKRW